MNKFEELAARSASIRKSMDERADALAKRMDAIPTKADAIFARHEGLLDDHEAGIKSMEDALRDLAGHNGGPLDDTSQNSANALSHQGTGATEANAVFVAPESDPA